MEILRSYEFKKKSTSRYAPVVKALLDGAVAIRIKRGDPEWPEDAKLESVSGGISTLTRKEGRRARTFRENDDNLVVALWPEGEGPRAPRRRRRETVAA
jgi:hypothetical protein